MFDFLTGRRPSPAAQNTVTPASGRAPLKRERHLSRREEAKVYERGPSVIDFLPWAEYLPEDECLLLDDGVSVGAVFLITPAGTEGRTQERLDEIRDMTEKALQSSLDERDTHQWVVQFFCQDESDLTVEMDRIRGYVSPAAQGTAFTRAWLGETERHLKQISRPEGLFKDNVVTGVDWRGQMRRTRMVVYRYVNPRTREPYPPAVQLRQVCDRLVASLTLFFTPPRSDAENGVWWFDNMAHRAVPVERLTSAPGPGCLTGEKPRGEHINALMDMMPPGTLACLTLMVQPQNVLEEEFKQQGKKSLGDNLDSEMAREQVGEALEWLKQKHKLYRGALTFIIRAPDMSTLDRYQLSLSTTLMNDGLQPVNPEHELTPLNTLLRALPMCFNPEMDTNRWYTWLTFVQHFAGVAPIYGRSTGTGHPGLTFFNRGGELLNFDPIKDRIQSAHKLLFGPTGAGKSATLTVELCQQMAIHRPRLFLVESGNSFGPLADYYSSLGLTVNKVSIKPGKGTCLPVFADAHLLRDISDEALDESQLRDIDDVDDDEEDDDEEKRDILGEMEIAAVLMVTGGDRDEKLSRADRGLLRKALKMAADMAYDENRQMLPEDLKTVLESISTDKSLNDKGSSRWHPKMQSRASEMALALELMTEGFEGELFNREGEAWPEADVTIVDLGYLAREGYESQMALAVISLANTVNHIAERDQHDDRDIVFTIDEAHVVTANPLVSPYFAKISKMWRKLGTWLWLATQNLKDYPDTAEKMLNMAEWWICLTMPPDEIEQIARFRSLTEEQKAMLASARKGEKKNGIPCYTEGVVLARNWNALFRSVPPSLYLALGMTEKDEKAQRRKLMKTHQCSELEAVFMVARNLDERRGVSV
ncbi:conjugative transfer ATPase [Salmonella enterica]|nr:conjugative transfer ATPase [Salmonella enterica]